MSPRDTLVRLALKGIPLALPVALLPGLAGSPYVVLEPLHRDGCATLLLYNGAMRARLELDAYTCPLEVLKAWPGIVAHGLFRISMRDGVSLVAEAEGNSVLQLVGEARRRLLGVSPIVLRSWRPRRLDLLLAAMAGLVHEWNRKKRPVRRNAGLPIAEIILGRRIRARTWYSAVADLVQAGALLATGYRGRVEPVRRADLYYSALYLLDPDHAREIASAVLELLGPGSTSGQDLPYTITRSRYYW